MPENQPGLPNQVELILIEVTHQPFGILMSQVYNIINPDGQALKIRQAPKPELGQEWGEIEYRRQVLPIIELARLLYLPLVEPLEESQVLLSGEFQSDGPLRQSFGVACNDILNVVKLPIEDLRPVPAWLFHKRLGKLIWSVALLEPELLMQRYSIEGLSLNFGRSELPAVELEAVVSSRLMPDSRYWKAERKREVKPKDERQPILLLDLEAIRQRMLVK